MQKSIVCFVWGTLILTVGCNDFQSRAAEEEKENTRLVNIINAVHTGAASPMKYYDELLENKDASQDALESSIYSSGNRSIKIEAFLMYSFYQWEYFEHAYRMANKVQDEDRKMLIRFVKGESLDDFPRPLFGDYRGPFGPETVLRDYRDDKSVVKGIFDRMKAEKLRLRRSEKEAGYLFSPNPQGVFYSVALRAKNMGLCEFVEILHEYGRFEFDLWGLGAEERYEDLFDREVAPAFELEYFRLASVLAAYFQDCGQMGYAEFWWEQAFRLYSVFQEMDDGNWMNPIHVHLYERMLEDAPEEMKALQFGN